MEKRTYQPDEIMRVQIKILSPKDMFERIHINLKRSNYPLEEEQSKKTDIIMGKILEDGIIDDLYRDATKNKSEEEIRSMEKDIYYFIESQLITYYYALYNDNIDLYNKMSEKNISLGEIPGGDRLYLLNKELRDTFTNDKEFFEYISMFDSAIGKFYNSLFGLNTENRKKTIDSFLSIIKSNKDYLYENKKNNEIYKNLLTSRNFENFGKEFLEKLNSNQKKLINELNYHLEPESLSKIKELLEKYPNFSYTGEDKLLTDTFLELFTIDEIGKMNDQTKYMYTCALREGLAKRLHILLEKYPDFTCPKGFIKPQIFDNIEFDTMSMLSPEAKIEIANLKNRDIVSKTKKIVKSDLRKTSNILKIFGKKNKYQEDKTTKKPTRRKMQ